MSDIANTPPGNTPQQSPAPVAKSSPLKVLIPIVMLMAVIFGVTFFAQYTPNKPDDDSNSDRGKRTAKITPLTFGNSIRRWDPVLKVDPSNFQDWIFPGFYEMGTTHRAAFWLENKNSAPVNMKLAGTNCVGVRVAAFPPDATDQLLLYAAISGIPQGLVSALPMGIAGPAPNFASDRLNWQEFDLRANQSMECKIPAAPSGKQLFPNLWGVVELQFEVLKSGPERMGATFEVNVEGNSQPEPATLMILVEGVDPIDTSTKFIDTGEWKDFMDPRTYDFYVFSSTRGSNPFGLSSRANLVAPTTEVKMPGGFGQPGEFVTVSAPVRVLDSELNQVILEVIKSAKRPIKIATAYRYTVTVKPKVGENRADIGPLEREIFLDFPEMKSPRSIRVKGMVRGAMWLDNDRTDIDLPTYRAANGIYHSTKIIAEQRDVVVEVLRDECRPKFIDVQLKKLPPASDRGYYELSVTIPKNGPTGVWNGTIMLEMKGSRPQRMSIPIRGSGKY